LAGASREKALAGMKVAEAQKHQTALKGLIHLFEDALVRTVAASATNVDFDPILVIDMRFGMFQSFILSLRADGNFYAIPRAINVEETDNFSVARESTTLCAYRKKKASNWKVCSESQLEYKAGLGDFDVAHNAISYALALPEKERVSNFERLWFTFLSLLTETDSGQDYKRIAFVIDEADHLLLLQSALPKVGSRLDKGGQKWQSAVIIPISSTTDIYGFAFLNNPRALTESHHEYLLLLLDAKQAIEVTYNGSDFHFELVRSVNLERYEKIAIVGEMSSQHGYSHILLYADTTEFEIACLIGYIHWWLQIDEERLDRLRRKLALLSEQLIQIKAETITLQNLHSRLQNVLRKLNGI
jgi:hypothetical protein